MHNLSPILEHESYKHPYLCHSILSLVFLIEDVLHPSYKGTSIPAVQHSVAASKSFRQSQIKVEEKNWFSIISFGVIFILYQCAAQQACPDAEFNILETLRVLRGSVALEAATTPFLLKSKFWPLIQARSKALAGQYPDAKMNENFDTLERIIYISIENASNDGNDNARAELNRQAFHELRYWLHRCKNSPESWLETCRWPAQVTLEYLELLEDRDDIALLIFIHWCAVIYRSRKRWFISAWARRAAMMSIKNLKADWGTLLEWPLAVLAENFNPPAKIAWHGTLPYRPLGTEPASLC